MKLFKVIYNYKNKEELYLTSANESYNEEKVIRREIEKLNSQGIFVSLFDLMVTEIKEVNGYKVVLLPNKSNTVIPSYTNWKGCSIASVDEIVTNRQCQILSDRHDECIPLISNKFNVITAEDYDKWYGLYYVTVNENNKPILIKFTYGDILDGMGNSFHPKYVVDFALANNLKIDTISYIAICKNFIEYNDGNSIPKELLPSLEDLDKVLVNGNGISFTYHLRHDYDLISYIKYTNNK